MRMRRAYYVVVEQREQFSLLIVGHSTVRTNG